MTTSTHKRTFITSAAVALTAVLVGAGALGLMSNNSSASASDVLPSALNAQDLGEGGLLPSSVRLVTETERYSVWTARDRADNICQITYATPEGNAAAACADEKLFREVGLPSSMQVGVADEGDLGITTLQTYLLPEGVDVEAAAKAIPGSVAVDQLVVRYGPIELDRTTTISVPSKDGTFELRVFGRDSI